MVSHDIHHDEHHGAEDGPHSTFSGYLTGFVLSVILTAIPFWLVMSGIIVDRSTVSVLALSGLALAQIIVHMVFFLHMDGKAEGGWTMVSTVFTLIFVVIILIGTLWVMFNMNINMMPMHGDMDGMPQMHHHDHSHHHHHAH